MQMMILGSDRGFWDLYKCNGIHMVRLEVNHELKVVVL